MNIKYVIPDVHMSSSHKTLNSIIENHMRANPLIKRSLDDGGLVLFLNSRADACKIYEKDGEVLAYLRSRYGSLTIQKIESIGKIFGGSTQYSQAARSALRTYFEQVLERKRA